MPSKLRDKPRKKPWRAAVKWNWQDYFLGYFPTAELAHNAEIEFKLERLFSDYTGDKYTLISRSETSSATPCA